MNIFITSDSCAAQWQIRHHHRSKISTPETVLIFINNANFSNTKVSKTNLFSCMIMKELSWKLKGKGEFFYFILFFSQLIMILE